MTRSRPHGAATGLTSSTVPATASVTGTTA